MAHSGDNRRGEPGLPTFGYLAALVLGEVLRPLDMAMKVRAHKRFSETAIDNSDDGAEDETHPMGYIDNVGAAIPHVDVLFFFEEFNHLGRPFGLYLNPSRQGFQYQQVAHAPYPGSRKIMALKL